MVQDFFQANHPLNAIVCTSTEGWAKCFSNAKFKPPCKADMSELCPSSSLLWRKSGAQLFGLAVPSRLLPRGFSIFCG